MKYTLTDSDFFLICRSSKWRIIESSLNLLTIVTYTEILGANNMEINGNSGSINRYNQKPQNAENTQNKETEETAESRAASEAKELAKKEKMKLFKKDLHKEISAIYGKSSSSLLSNSVHITDEALEKMQSDPKFKDEMMEALRKEVESSYNLSNKVNVTTKISIDGYSSYSANVFKTDSNKMIADKEAIANKKARGALFYSADEKKKEVSAKKTDNSGKSWLDIKREQQIYEMGIREKNVIERSHKRTSFIRTFTSS